MTFLNWNWFGKPCFLLQSEFYYLKLNLMKFLLKSSSFLGEWGGDSWDLSYNKIHSYCFLLKTVFIFLEQLSTFYLLYIFRLLLIFLVILINKVLVLTKRCNIFGNSTWWLWGFFVSIVLNTYRKKKQYINVPFSYLNIVCVPFLHVHFP